MIWFKKYNVKDWESRVGKTIHDSLGIRITHIGEDSVSGTMPIDWRTFQPMKILHGGASVVLAESLGSIGSAMLVDPDKYYAVGQSINANHVRPGLKGLANGIAKPIHIGTRSHIWDIEIFNDDKKLMCTCRLTMAIVQLPVK
ncbi:MAG: 1,4-dihydroxy-2-naphthoyl-CoA hydrolase [Salibacteraceae bacterium]|jgi:1,4-dihydroxy-2-naphthoyl-CoA hydrolase